MVLTYNSDGSVTKTGDELEDAYYYLTIAQATFSKSGIRKWKKRIEEIKKKRSETETVK